MSLTAIAPREIWVGLELNFNERSGLNCCSVDEDGMRVTAFKAWANRLCPVIRRSTKNARAICGYQASEVLKRIERGGGPEVGRCRAGMVRVFVPVLVGGRFMGALGGCGKLPEDGEVDAIVVSSATGLGKGKIAALLRDIDKISPDEISALVHHLEEEVRELTARL